MIKKIGIFFSTILVALVGLFSINPLKNTTELQYFNKTIQNAVVETATNEYTFYLDNEVNNYTELNENYELFYSSNEDGILEIFLENDNKIELTTINLNFTTDNFLEVPTISFANNNIVVIIKFKDNLEIQNTILLKDTWYYFSQTEVAKVLYFKVSNVYTDYENLQGINELLTPYIGNLTDFPQSTPSQEETALDKISTIINSIIDWFITIFNGLGDIFVVYENGSITGLSTWGTIVFIPLAIGLVITVLRWVIRLVRGI